MMAEKQLMLLHELLKEEQEPFDLKSFISHKRSQLTNKNSSSSPPKRLQKSKHAAFGFFGSFLKTLKDRSKSSKPLVRICDEEGQKTDDITVSCSVEMMIYGDFEFLQTRFCASPFIFSGIRTPESCSPVASPFRRPINQEKENYEHSDNGNGVNKEEKEQCSPVSVLDSFFEDDEHKSVNAEDDEDEEDDDDNDYDLESSYANVQRAKQQLLERLRRFEKLAELDPMELERKFLEDEDYQIESSVASSEDPDGREPSISLSPDVKQSVDRFLNDAFCLSNLQHKMCTDLLTVEKKNKEFELELDMVDLDFQRGLEGQETTVEEIELAVFGYLVEELLQEFN